MAKYDVCKLCMINFSYGIDPLHGDGDKYDEYFTRESKENQNGARGYTLFHHCIRSSHKKCVDNMILAGFNDFSNNQNETGSTPLHIAIYSQHPGPIKFLIELGVDTSIKNNEGKTAFEMPMPDELKKYIEKLFEMDIIEDE